MNLLLILGFKTFKSFLLLYALEPKASLAQLAPKRPNYTVFCSCSHLNSSHLKYSHFMSINWDASNGNVFRGSTVTDTCHHNAEIFHSKKPLGIPSVTEVPQITTMSQSCLLQWMYLGLSRNLSHNHRPTTIFLIARAEDTIRKDCPRNVSLYPLSKFHQIFQFTPNPITTRRTLCSDPSQLGLGYSEHSTSLWINPIKWVQLVVTIRCNNSSLAKKYQFFLSCLNTFMCLWNNPV